MTDDDLDRHLRIIRTALYCDARDRLRLAINAAVRAEREACAAEADDFVMCIGVSIGIKEANMAKRIATAIRNRSNTP